ncbi:uncharacterized protein BXZ73DRAFT_89656 [Epithele typhae]|uniref:uncharacterized protein n=1 Tax=Epithele typhae TaxID=378194 RepID=UPI0020075A59|nr:uncharacterized protein BXZ73DRAFT_89656 [Epithele typhae]KAH9933987.1 hypothetical protein BXZ73DRAFT_89656 [Epithele typhae]
MTDVDSAKADFLASLDLQPSLTQTWVKIASVWMEGGDPKKAFECFDEAIKHNPNDPDIYYHRGQVLFIMNEFAEAAENYTKSTELDDKFVFSHIQLAVAQYKSGNLANSMATFRRTLKAFPDRSEPQNYYGELLLDQQRYPDAIEKFERAVEIERAKPLPMNVLPMVNKGLAMFQYKQDITAAEKCCQEALEIDPECEAAVATLAQLSLQQGKIDIAMKMFDRQAQLARSEPELVSALTYQFRQVAFYPHMNSTNKPQKPFSRSAAKRESVMALGSIEYLQHYFTKTGIAAESDPLKKAGRELRPAIGGAAITGRPKRSPSFTLPPSPAIPQSIHPTFPPYVKTFETDPENLRPGVVFDLSIVATGWQLDAADPLKTPHAERNPDLLSAGPAVKTKTTVDVLDLLKMTTRAVRTVRNYLVSLPDDSAVPGQTTRASYRPQTLSSAPVPKRQVSQPNDPSDPVTRVRTLALDVLAVLRELEERARLPLDHDAYDAQSDHGSSASAGGGPSRGTSPSSHLEEPDYLDADTSVSISFVAVGASQKQVPVWDDESSYDFNSMTEAETRNGWDERLVVGGGWLYRQDMRMEDIAKERDLVSSYIDSCDEVLFGGFKEGKRGWERERERMEKKERIEREMRSKGRRVSAGDVLGDSGPSLGRAKRRVVSTGLMESMRDMAVTEEPEEMESLQEEQEEEAEAAVADSELPPWAKRSTYPDDDYGKSSTPPCLWTSLIHRSGRLHALLVALLPATMLRLLPLSSTDQREILTALSSGQLLCHAYNHAVRRSKKPWGYVSRDAIHDIAALEEAQTEETAERNKRGWTFRRTDNLRLWAAALKLRYSIPIVMPNRRKETSTTRPGTPALGSSPLPSPAGSTVNFPGGVTEDAVLFDAPMVARKEEGWELMLERLVWKWMDAVVSERRGER